MPKINLNWKFKNKKTKFILFFLFAPLFLISGCDNNKFYYGSLAYRGFVKLLKDHFGWQKDEQSWGDEYDDSKWDFISTASTLKSDIKSYLDGDNYKTNLNNQKNWSALYWFPKTKITAPGTYGSADYDLDMSNIDLRLIAVGNYRNPNFKDNRYNDASYLTFPNASDTNGHFTMYFSFNGVSGRDDDIYKITYNFTVSDTAGSLFDASFSIKNVENFGTINKFNEDPNIKNIIDNNIKNDANFLSAFKKKFALPQGFPSDFSGIKVSGYSLLDKSSDISQITYDQNWNLASGSDNILLRNSEEYFKKHSSQKNQNFWFTDGSLGSISFKFENPNKPGWCFLFSFNISWDQPGSGSQKFDRSSGKQLIFKWIDICDAAYVKTQ